MAGIATHLIIAREIIKLLPEGALADEGLFIAGSIAPDAIHAREGFVRADKKHTHLRDDIPDKDFILQCNIELFHQRVADFILKNWQRKDGLLDLYRGYVVHLLTDELYMLTIRQEFVNRMEKEGINQSDKDFFIRIVTDMNRNDFLLAVNYADKDEIRKRLEQVKPYQIEGMLSEDELTRSRNWVIKRYFYDRIDLFEPVYISYDRTQEFVKMASEEIVRRLSKEGNL
ncbi:MAG TPA: zinc dependent phospholipase C family protein [Bacteroidales bacterium]|nr:zinc dependent phospholipase C family protein [Bacteroidales bacterium]